MFLPIICAIFCAYIPYTIKNWTLTFNNRSRTLGKCANFL